MSPDALLVLAEAADREGMARLHAGDQIAALELLARAELYRRTAEALRLRLKGDIVTDVDAMAEAKRRGRPVVSSHPFPRATNVRKWANDHGFPEGTVKSWYADGAHRRAIPRKAAELIRDEFGIPLSAWRSVTDE